ncbi:MAG: hypothetical protein ACQEVT_09455 [Pseudomonadota bacterium]|uniref:hypothetical protein n=1 Tax=Roseovarius TaxID=74030 RepID=UPI0022A8AFFC|nr:hypothetical protein [Roseovarius sp. EGI FJ00037]MCZ0812968.1 hypothetical protein [Roseovarius sp. EGI FJ00037]
MINPKAMESDIAKLETLLHERLGVRGPSFEKRLKRAGRRLPRFARRAGARIAKAQFLLKNPRLARLVDQPGTAHSIAILRGHLETINAGERRKSLILGFLGSVVFNLLALAFLIAALLRWQGVI